MNSIICTFRSLGNEGQHSHCRLGLGAYFLFTVSTTSGNGSFAGTAGLAVSSEHNVGTGQQHHK